jgi:hypothetical protein
MRGLPTALTVTVTLEVAVCDGDEPSVTVSVAV